MSYRVRLIVIVTLAFLLGAALFVWRPTSSAVLYSGFARAESGPLTLEVTVNPPVATPGATMQMIARITNRDGRALTPSIQLTLPRGVMADIYALPAGATFNLQENRVDWLPVVPANGALEFTLDMTVQATDVVAPEQSVSALIRHQGDERQAAAPLWIGIAPLIGEAQALGQVSVGQPIRLRASVAGPGPIDTIWDLGDGRRLELAEPEVAFPTAGQYDIIVEAVNPAGRVSRRLSLTVLPQPVAAFRPADDTPAIGQPVTFLSGSGGQPPLRVFWDFGDGSTVMGEQQPVHTYRQGGTYRVRLTVENDYGRSEAVWDVRVGVAPVADMVVPGSAAVGQPLAAQAFGDDTVLRFLWDMGDGRRHEGANITHMYRRPGDYYVTMTADNGFGQHQAGQWVHVEGGITNFYLPLAAHQDSTLAAVPSAESGAALELNPAVQALEETFTLEPLQFQPGTSPAEQLLAYINAARARFSLPPMNYNFELSAAGQQHALDKSRFPDNPHVGTDGTTAAERLLRSGYRGGYAGEATAWGFSDPRLAVEFWINSDSHRPLLLNQLGTEVGIGYVEDMSTSNVWHWTAEFGINYGSPIQPALRVQAPLAGHSALDTDVVNYSWMWPLPLGAGEHFVVYLVTGGELLPAGSIAQPVYGSRYVLSVDARQALAALNSAAIPAGLQWLVRLEDGSGNVLAEGERRAVTFHPDAENPPVVVATPSPTAPIIVATPAAATPTVTPTFMPTDEPPAGEPPPVIIPATPEPSPTP